MAQTSRPCKGCGEPIYRTAPVAPIRQYHGPECRPRCSVNGCEKPDHSRGLCTAHATRAARTGDPETPKTRNPNRGSCSVEGCDAPSKKRGWCASHYAQWQMTGAAKPFQYKWADELACLVCGAPTDGFRSRKVCSDACKRIFYRYKGSRPTALVCAQCGDEFDVIAPTSRTGKRKRIDSLLCDPCRRARSLRHKVSPHMLAKRDGPLCGICGETVDMTLKAPDEFSASVDHIRPYSLGGSHDPSNLQLAHLWCNKVKHNSEGFVI